MSNYKRECAETFPFIIAFSSFGGSSFDKPADGLDGICLLASAHGSHKGRAGLVELLYSGQQLFIRDFFFLQNHGEALSFKGAGI